MISATGTIYFAMCQLIHKNVYDKENDRRVNEKHYKICSYHNTNPQNPINSFVVGPPICQ